MEYQVPQFIEVEDKIIGPLTLKQFIYVAGAGGLCIVFFVYLHIVIALLLSAAVIALAAALSFYKVNGKSFIEVLEAGFNYYTKAKLFLWKHKTNPELKKKEPSNVTTSALNEPVGKGVPKLTRGKLSELAWSLDIRSPESGLKSQK